MIKIVTMVSEKGLFIAGGGSGINYQGVRNSLPNNLRFNGNVTEVQGTHHRSWGFLEGVTEITSVDQIAHGYDIINKRWVRDDLPELSDLPEEISCEEACEYEDDEYDWVIGSDSKYARYSKFYTRKYDTKQKDYESVEFEVANLGTVSAKEATNFTDMVILLKNRHSGRVDPIDLSSVVKYSELEQMLVPDLMIHNRPCKLSQDNTYSVIRNHIKDNIDGRVARVTSDYDFCFTVEKVVSIKPYINKTEITKSNGRPYAKPRFNTREVQNKLHKIFEMCPAKKYQKYTPIRSFEGESLEDLIENIKLYLEELMSVINEPVSECEHCHGTGYNIQEVFKGENK